MHLASHLSFLPCSDCLKSTRQFRGSFLQKCDTISLELVVLTLLVGIQLMYIFLTGFLYSVANVATKTAVKVKDSVKETVEGKVHLF